jgi:hypothetical protein
MQTAQSSAHNRLPSIEQHCARRILMTHDRIEAHWSVCQGCGQKAALSMAPALAGLYVCRK